MAEVDPSQTKSRNQSSSGSSDVSNFFFKSEKSSAENVESVVFVDAPLTLTASNNEQTNKNTAERSPEGLHNMNGEPERRFITAAARKQYVDTDHLDSSLNILIVQAANTLQRAQQLNQETQPLLVKLNEILRAAHQRIQMCTYVFIFIFSPSRSCTLPYTHILHITVYIFAEMEIKWNRYPIG